MLSSKLATAFNLISGILALGVQMLVSFFLQSYLVATVGEAANGFTQLANNFVSYASLITLAFNSMGSRFISSAHHQGRDEDAVAYYSTLVVCNAILCIAFLPLAIGIVLNVGSIVNLGNASLPDVMALFAFVFANYAVSLFTSLFSASMFVTNKMYLQNAINLVRNILNALLLICAYSLFEARVSYVGLVSLILAIASVPVYLIIKRRITPGLKFDLHTFSGKFVRRLTSSGIWNTVNQCGNVLTTGLDLLFANWFVGASPMGILSVAKTVPSAIIQLAVTINSNFEPELVILYAKEGAKALFGRLKFEMKVSNLIVSVPIGVFFGLSVPFFTLWMPSLDSHELALLAFLSLMSYIPWAGPQVLFNVFTATNHLKVNSLTFVAGSVVNIVVVLVLLRFTNLSVYAIAGTSSIISILRNILIVVPYDAHLLGIKRRLLYLEMLRSTSSCALSAACAVLVGRIVNPSSWGLLILCILFACVLAWLLVWLVTFSGEERSTLLILVKGKLGKH